MIRGWIATALLAGSWLFGLGYYQPANVAVWFGLLMAAVILLGDVPVPQLSRTRAILAVVLLLPSAWLVPLPYKAIPLLFAGGLLLTSAPVPRRWPRWLGQGGIAGAAILLGQSLALEGYAMLTARSHELPAPLAQLLAVVTRAVGVETAVDGSLARAPQLGTDATRGRHVGPAAGRRQRLLLGGRFGSARVECMRSGSGGTASGLKTWLLDALRLAAIGAIWAPLRAAVLIGLWLQRSLRADSLGEVNVADVFVNGWLHLLLLAGPVLFASCVLGKTTHGPEAGWRHGLGGHALRRAPRLNRRAGWFGVPLLLIAAGTGLAGLSLALGACGAAASRPDHDRRTPLDVGADDDALWHDGVWRSRLVQLCRGLRLLRSVLPDVTIAGDGRDR